MTAIVWGVLVALSQLADGLTYQLAHGHGQEMNPVAAGFIGLNGPGAILGIKVVAGVALGVAVWYLLRRVNRERVWAFVPFVALLGFVGAITNLIGSMS